MSTDHDRSFTCPYKDCGQTVQVNGQEPARLIAVHTYRGKPCPGGGYNVDMSIVAEVRKMMKRAKSLGL